MVTPPLTPDTSIFFAQQRPCATLEPPFLALAQFLKKYKKLIPNKILAQNQPWESWKRSRRHPLSPPVERDQTLLRLIRNITMLYQSNLYLVLISLIPPEPRYTSAAFLWKPHSTILCYHGVQIICSLWMLVGVGCLASVGVCACVCVREIKLSAVDSRECTPA